MGLGIALGSFLKCLVNPEFGRQVKKLAMGGEVPTSPLTDPPTEQDLEAASVEEDESLSAYECGAIQLLGELQKEGRLLDFLEEDLSQYGDEEIGSSVRSIHEGLKKAIVKILEKEKVINQEEESSYRVNSDYNASEIKLSGQVSDKFPLKGILVHPGWKVSKMNLPERPRQAEEVIVPAEVEID